MRSFYIAVLIMFLSVSNVLAVEITGTIRGTESGNPVLAGATVRTKDGLYATTTATDGTYSITVPSSTTVLLATHQTHAIELRNISVGTSTSLASQDFALEPGLLISQGHPESSYSASASYDPYLPILAFDGNFQDASRWIAPANTSWIEVDLGSTCLISKILMSACMSPSGDTVEEIRVSDSPIGSSAIGATLVHTFSQLTENLTLISKDFSPTVSGRYVQIKTTSSPSWNSWYEIQIYGAVGTISGVVSSSASKLSAVAGTTISTMDGAYSVVSDSKGTYSLTIPSGSAKIIATKDGYAPCPVAVTLGANQTANVNIDLKKAQSVASIKAALPYSDGRYIANMNPVEVIAGHDAFKDGGLYIEELDRTRGIRIVPGDCVGDINVGDKIKFVGYLATAANGERYINVVWVTEQVSAAEIKPLGMSNKSVAGAGTLPTGLLVTVWGKVTYVNTYEGYLYIDDGSKINDGSGHVGIKIYVGTSADTTLAWSADVGDFIKVTGIAQPVSPLL